MPCTGLIGMNSGCVVHVPGIGFVVSGPAGGIGTGAGFVGGTGVGVPAGGGVVGGGVVGGGVVGGGVVGGGVVGGGFVPPDATFVPLLYVQPFKATATIRTINEMENFLILALFS
jgi:hypothetical protein